MSAGSKALKQYNSDVTAFSACLDAETTQLIAAAGPDAKPEQIKKIQAAQTKRNDDAVDLLHKKADEFNAQVHAYKSRQ